MVLAFQGVQQTQIALAKTLGMTTQAGIPYSRLPQLSSKEVTVSIAQGTINDIAAQLMQHIPVIAFINAGELTHWRQAGSIGSAIISHAVVIVGLTDQGVEIMDPGLATGPTLVTEAEFLLAWSWMDYEYATIIVTS